MVLGRGARRREAQGVWHRCSLGVLVRGAKGLGDLHECIDTLYRYI